MEGWLDVQNAPDAGIPVLDEALGCDPASRRRGARGSTSASDRRPHRAGPGQRVVLESTTYPGTTRDVLLPELEKGGLAAGRDFFLAYSPEREDPGNPKFSAGNIPKVVGGWDEASGALARDLYGAVVPEVV